MYGECWLWTGPRDRHGFGMIRRSARRSSRLAAHAVAWEIHRHICTSPHRVRHVCARNSCVNPAHLTDTPVFAGMRRPHPTSADVAEIRCEYELGRVSRKDVARGMNLSTHDVSGILHGLSFGGACR